MSDLVISLYTDGAFSPSRKVCGSAWAFIDSEGNLIKCGRLRLVSGDNNVAEMCACILGLNSIESPQIKKINLFSDSLYLLKCGWDNWSRKKNGKLWEAFDKEIKRLKELGVEICPTHVAGHAKDGSENTKWNNFVDFLATTITK